MSEPTTKAGRALHDWLGWHPIDGRDDRILAIEVEAYERGCVAGMAMEKYAPQPDTASRAWCVCGRGVLPANWANHLKRTGTHAALTLAPQPAPDTTLDVERLAAAVWGVTASRIPIPMWESAAADQYREKALADAAEIVAAYAVLEAER